MLAVYVSTLEAEYSRSGVLFASDPGEKIFVKFPLKRLGQVRKVLALKKLYHTNNACIVLMSPNHTLAPIFRVLTKFQIVLDAGWPLSDSTGNIGARSLQTRHILNRLIDKASFKCATRVILESREQVKFVKAFYGVQESKLFSILTGFNEIEFGAALDNPQKPPEIANNLSLGSKFVLFRGKDNYESGLNEIISTAQLLEAEVTFVLVTNKLINNCPRNVILINRFVTYEELVWLYTNSTLVLGQISKAERLNRTIPHKLFEAAYFSKCYLSPPNPALFELLDENSFIRVSEITPEALSSSIKLGLSDPNLRANCERHIKLRYIEKASQSLLGARIREIVEIKC